MRKIWLYIILASLMISLVGWHATAQQGIVIDGKMNDWQGIPPLTKDPQGDTSEEVDAEGADLRALYVIMDDEYLYFVIDIYGSFSPTLFRNFHIQLNNDRKGDDEYCFGMRINGRNWVFDLVKDPSWNTIYDPAPGVEITASSHIIEGKILRASYNIPSKVTIWMRVATYVGEKVVNVDRTGSTPLEDDFGKYMGLINSATADYKNAQDSLNAKEILLKAKDAFDKAKQIYPGRNLPEQASNVDEYLSKIEKIMQADALFTEANNLLNAKDYEASKIKLLAARKIYEEMSDIPKMSEFDVMLAKIEDLLKIKQEADSAFSDAKTAFNTKDYQKAKELFTQAKDKYTQLEDSEKVKQCEDYIKQSEENMKKTGIEILPVVLSALVLFYYKKWSR